MKENESDLLRAVDLRQRKTIGYFWKTLIVLFTLSLLFLNWTSCNSIGSDIDKAGIVTTIIKTYERDKDSLSWTIIINGNEVQGYERTLINSYTYTEQTGVGQISRHIITTFFAIFSILILSLSCILWMIVNKKLNLGEWETKR